MPQPSDTDAVLQYLKRIDAKLDALVLALVEEDEPPGATLDGEPAGEEREQDQPL